MVPGVAWKLPSSFATLLLSLASSRKAAMEKVKPVATVPVGFQSSQTGGEAQLHLAAQLARNRANISYQSLGGTTLPFFHLWLTPSVPTLHAFLPTG